jgi:uncharacterized protein (TIGR02118 family)
MYKVVWFARFPQGSSKEEGYRYWAQVHGPLAARSTIEHYIQSHVVGPVPAISGVAAEEPGFDGYSLAWWSDRAAYEATMASPEWEAVREDGEQLWDNEWLAGMVAELHEHVMIEGPRSPFKVVWVCSFKPGLDPHEAHDYWVNVHGPIFKALDIDRYVQNHVSGPLPGARRPGFDGFSECWFRDEAQFRAAVSSDVWATAVEDAPNFLDMSKLDGALLREHVIKGDPLLVSA